MVILTAFDSCETTDQSEWRLTDDVITSIELNWTAKSVVNILVTKSPFSEIDFKEYSLKVRSDYSEWWTNSNCGQRIIMRSRICTSLRNVVLCEINQYHCLLMRSFVCQCKWSSIHNTHSLLHYTTLHNYVHKEHVLARLTGCPGAESTQITHWRIQRGGGGHTGAPPPFFAVPTCVLFKSAQLDETSRGKNPLCLTTTQ